MSNTAPAKQVRKPKKLPFVIMCILSAIVAVLNVLLAGLVVPDFIYNIGSTVLNGGVSMVIFFFVNKMLFPAAKD